MGDAEDEDEDEDVPSDTPLEDGDDGDDGDEEGDGDGSSAPPAAPADVVAVGPPGAPVPIGCCASGWRAGMVDSHATKRDATRPAEIAAAVDQRIDTTLPLTETTEGLAAARIAREPSAAWDRAFTNAGWTDSQRFAEARRRGMGGGALLSSRSVSRARLLRSTTPTNPKMSRSTRASCARRSSRRQRPRNRLVTRRRCRWLAG